MSTRCVNCGAPGRGPDCTYCGSPMSVRDPSADLPGFEELEAMISSFDFDPQRLSALRTFVRMRLGKKYTAGQVRRLISLFDFDPFRLSAAKALVPLVTDRRPLFHAAGLFDFDPFKQSFMELLSEDLDEAFVRESVDMAKAAYVAGVAESRTSRLRSPDRGGSTALLVASVLVPAIFGTIVIAGLLALASS